MVLDIDGQPINDVIGGVADYLVNIGHVSANRATAYDEAGNFTSPEQGRDYDAAEVARATIITPDTNENTVKKVIPWGLIVVAGAVLYLVLRGK